MTFMQLSVSDDRIHYDVDEPRLQAGLSPGEKVEREIPWLVGSSLLDSSASAHGSRKVRPV